MDNYLRRKWNIEEEQLFFDIWGKKAAQLKRYQSNVSTYEEMAKELQSKNFPRTAVEIKSKINNVLTKYKKCREEVKQTGQSSWPLYSKVHEIVGCSWFSNLDTLCKRSNKFLRICRICLYPAKPLRKLNFLSGQNLRIDELLNSVAPFMDVHNTDQLPQQICSACLHKLEIAYEFQQMCIASNQRLHEILMQEEPKRNADKELHEPEEAADDDYKVEIEVKVEDIALTEQPVKEKITQEPQMEMETLPSAVAQIKTEIEIEDTELMERMQQEDFMEPQVDLQIVEPKATTQKPKTTTIRRFICRTCGKGFVQKKGLIMHIEMHITPKPRKSDSGLKQYKCTVCEKVFTRHGEYQFHTRMHSKDRIFACEHCTYRFNVESALTRHIKLKHKEFYASFWQQIP